MVSASRMIIEFIGDVEMKATIKRERDLKGATPETLARALLRPRLRGKPVVRNETSAKQVAPDKTGDGVSHLRKSV